MHPIMVILIIVISFIALFLVAQWLTPVGHSVIVACCMVGHALMSVTSYLNNGATYCHAVCGASLQYPRGSRKSDYWVGITVLSRLVYFVLALCVLVGELYNTLLASPALFQTATHAQLPSIIDFASAALFLATPALFGAVMLESCGIIPEDAGLFSHSTSTSRWIVGILSGIFLTLAIFLDGYVYLFRAAYLIDPASTQGMSLVIFGVLGVLLAVASVFALWALVVGGAGLVSILFWGCAWVCHALRAILLFVPSLLDILVMHLSHGKLSIYQAVGTNPIPHHLSPASPTMSFQQYVNEDKDDIIPVQVISEEPMHNPEKNASLVFIGPFGSRMLSPMAEKLVSLRATDVLLTSGHLDLSRAQSPAALPGMIDISPSQSMRHTALLQGQTEAAVYQTLLPHMGDQLVEAHLKTKADPALLLFFLDARTLGVASDMLRAVKRRLPLHALAVVTSLSVQDIGQKEIQDGVGSLCNLHAEGTLESILVIDPRSPFATHHGEDTQRHFLSQALVSLLIATKHSSYNLSGVRILKMMRSLSPFTTMSFASEVIAAGKPPKRWAWIPGITQNAGVGDYSDILTQTRAAIEKTITAEATRAFAAQVKTDTPSILFCSEPIALRDPRFAASVQDIARYVGTTYSKASAITTCGNGCPYPHSLGGRYLVQVTCLYPLHHTIFAQYQAGKQLPAVTARLAPTNGQSPIDQASTQILTDITLTQQPDASTRRGRKKTGQQGEQA